MARLSRIDGVKDVIAAFKKKQAKYAQGVSRGLRRAGLFIQRESQKIVPVDQGNLKASAFTRTIGSGFNTEVSVGYTANYAVYVHENLDNAHGEEFNRKWWKAIELANNARALRQGRLSKKKRKELEDTNSRIWKYQQESGLRMSLDDFVSYFHERGPDQQAKFLEDPIRKKEREIVDMILQSMKEGLK